MVSPTKGGRKTYVGMGNPPLVVFWGGKMERKNIWGIVLVASVILLAVITTLITQSLSSPTGGAVFETQNPLEAITESGELNVCYVEYPPAVIKDPNTQSLSGHFVDTLENIAKEMGVKVNYQETSWTTFIIGLKTGKCDLSIAPTFKTINRAKSVSFTRALFYAGNSAISMRGNNRVSSLEDLEKEGLKIAVTQGEAGHEYAKANLPSAELIVHPGPDQSEAFSDVSAGRADVALGDFWATKMYAREHPEVRDVFAADPYNLMPVGWAVRTEDVEWLNFVNTALETLESQGKFEEFEGKYDAHWIHK